ncbi:MAG: DnaJ domain-containing protein [Phenylobacterium sp.]
MLLYLALGAAVLWLILLAGQRGRVLGRREWRLVSGACAIAAFAGAAFIGLRGAWGTAIVLVVMGLWFAVSARRTGETPLRRGEQMSLTQARSMLGVGPEATPEEIQAAYTRLMRMAHPDKGGTSGLAAQLNAARARLLQK